MTQDAANTAARFEPHELTFDLHGDHAPATLAAAEDLVARIGEDLIDCTLRLVQLRTYAVTLQARAELVRARRRAVREAHGLEGGRG